MIVVDTSVWIDYFNGTITAETNWLDQLLGQQTLIIGDLILTEVLQGFRRQRHFEQAQQLMQRFPVVTMLGPILAIRSAQHYRQLRQRGITIRKTIDVMIGTSCIALELPLLYSDRDFDPMVQYLGLRSALV
jgi:hypothetical protein